MFSGIRRLGGKVKRKVKRLFYRTYPNVIEYSAFGPIIVNVNDQFIGKAFANGEYYDLKHINYLKKLIELKLSTRDKVVLFDVGGNIGSHSLAFSKLFGRRIQIHAFEAQRPVFHMFCGTMALNNVNNVICHLSAVSDKDGEVLEIQLPDYESANNFGGLELIPAAKSDNQNMNKSSLVQKVQTIRIDTLNEWIDIIKMDIEGMEDRALAGARQSIEKCRPFCLVEIAKTDAEFVFGFFDSLDYKRIDIGRDCIFIPKENEVEVRALIADG